MFYNVRIRKGVKKCPGGAIMSKKTKGQIVQEYLKKYPKMPTLTLAKMLYKEIPELFLSQERARSSIRYWRGAIGNANRKRLSDKSYLKRGRLSVFEDLPEGLKYYSDWKPYEVKGSKILRLADAHIPYHDKDALILALKYGRKKKIDTIVVDDFVDFFSVSYWEKDPRRRHFWQELEIIYEVLTIIRDVFPSVELIWMKGNHEERYERYMRVKAPELLGVDQFEFESIIKAKEFNITIIGDKRVLKIGELNCIHGHEFGRTFASPVNPARGLYLKGKENCIGGHYHQSSDHTEKSMNETVTTCWSVGCLCDLHPDYLPINKWNHGFAYIRKLGNKGNFVVNNRTIIDGEIY